MQEWVVKTEIAEPAMPTLVVAGIQRAKKACVPARATSLLNQRVKDLGSEAVQLEVSFCSQSTASHLGILR